MKILVLTSKENFVWQSMQEIIPYIEKTWTAVADDYTKVQILNVDSVSAQQLMSQVLDTQIIVLTCFNLKICKTAYFIRNQLKLDINFIIYVHNMATIAFWPFRRYANELPFKKNDLFITSCSNDEKNLLGIFKNPQILKIPFYVEQPDLQNLNKSFNLPEKVVYIGRISPQKNLHNLILAYALLKKRKITNLPTLVFFGKEDHLGAPNMGVENKSYQNFLNDLISQLQLNNFITFFGQVERHKISNYLSHHQCLVVSPSLHSDENFGMAILQSLLLGNQVLISDWGGHSDFKKTFFDRVSLMAVTNTFCGPSLSAEIIATQLEPLLLHRPLRSKIKTDSSYLINNQVVLIKSQLNKIKNFVADHLEFTDLADKIFAKSQDYSTQIQNNTKIFSDFTDKNFHEISQFYIGQVNRRESLTIQNQEKFYLAPWVNYENNQFIINDPHKGLLKVNNTLDHLQESSIYLSNGSQIKCTRDLVKELYFSGYLVTAN